MPDDSADAGGDEDGATGDPSGTDAPGGLEPFEVFVQWQRGRPHEHAETVNAPDPEMALMLAKRNVDVRSEPVSIWVAPRYAMRTTASGDTTLVPSTDRGYRNVQWYAEHGADQEEFTGTGEQ